ncbi:MAG: hypothetical protein MRERV_8c016 [Mycoplasmataceae bacterium RV_VA103A]|nr:MAG: hypothetical protein MRERV_8c016 [Mycoplasmataceae bacterium RV_VA103A]
MLTSIELNTILNKKLMKQSVRVLNITGLIQN